MPVDKLRYTRRQVEICPPTAPAQWSVNYITTSGNHITYCPFCFFIFITLPVIFSFYQVMKRKIQHDAINGQEDEDSSAFRGWVFNEATPDTQAMKTVENSEAGPPGTLPHDLDGNARPIPPPLLRM
jgi:hypothetical protein